jgi:hypothetical protein
MEESLPHIKRAVDKQWSRKQGQAGAYQVASQLLLRGVNVFFPAVDVGADLLTGSGVRVQVKSTYLSCRRGADFPAGAYWFHFYKQVLDHGRRRNAPRDFVAECDVVVLWGIDHNKFWVVPAFELTDCQCLVLGETPNRSYRHPNARSRKIAGFENRWDLIASHERLIHEPESVEQEVNS